MESELRKQLTNDLDLFAKITNKNFKSMVKTLGKMNKRIKSLEAQAEAQAELEIFRQPIGLRELSGLTEKEFNDAKVYGPDHLYLKDEPLRPLPRSEFGER